MRSRVKIDYPKCFKTGKRMIPESDIREVIKSLRRKNACSSYLCADCGSHHTTANEKLNDSRIISHGEPSRKKTEQKKAKRQKRQKRLRSMSSKRRAEQEVRVEVLMALLMDRGNACEAKIDDGCKLVATDGHELLLRSAGGDPTDPENIKLVCRQCHDWIHGHPKEARAAGLLRSRYERLDEDGEDTCGGEADASEDDD